MLKRQTDDVVKMFQKTPQHPVRYFLEGNGCSVGTSASRPLKFQGKSLKNYSQRWMYVKPWFTAVIH